MAIGTDLQSDVADALTEFGRAVTLRKTTAGTYNPADGSVLLATDAVVDYDTIGLLLGYNDRVVDGDLIKQGDRRCILKVKDLAVAPEVNDQLIVDVDTYRVMSFKTVEIGGIVVLYTLQLRKGG